MRTALLLPLVALVTALQAVAAGSHSPLNAITPAGATLKASCPFGSPPVYGWVPVLIELTNPSNRSVRWTVRQPNWGDAAALGRTISLTCPPGESRSSTLLFASGEVVSDSSEYAYGLGMLALTAVSDETSASGRFGDNASNQYRKDLVLRGPNVLRSTQPNPFIWVDFETRLAPVDWRAYQGYRAVTLADSEWRELSAAAKLALTHWLKTGGVLAIVATDPATTAATLGLPATDPGPAATACGLGHLRVMKMENPSEFDEWVEFIKTRSFTDANRQNASDTRMDRWAARLPGALGAPDRRLLNLWLVVLVVVFAILIGPVNLFIIAPAARRHRLFFSVPAISLATVLLLMMAVLMGDGLGGKGTRFVLIENRPAEGGHTNHLVQYQSSRCGVMFSTGFTAPGSVFVEGLTSPAHGSKPQGEFQLVPEADGVHAGGPWFASRTGQHFRLAAVVPTRGRIELSGTGGSAMLTSTFEFPLETLYFSNPSGEWWQADGLKPGQPAAVKPVTESTMRQDLTAALKAAPDEIDERVKQLLDRPQHFVALTAAPAAIATHRSIDWTDHGVVTGPLVTP